MEDRTERKLIFSVNGERFELSSIDPSTTLLEFLRCRTRYKSVKLGCGEGGCGACVVLLSKYDPVLDQVVDFTVSSCLTLLCSLHGCSITTSEGLGNSKDGFHTIHQRFAGFHASQCGFCTPGMCMSLFSALHNSKKSPRPDPSPGFSKLTVSEAEKAIVGNLCRCTGYRSIADACKSFAADVDLEDLGLNCFWRKEENMDANAKLSKLPLYTHSDQICSFPKFLKQEIKSKTLIYSNGYSWYSPVSVQELQSLLETDEAENGTKVKLVVGNTGVSYYKEPEKYNMYVDLTHIPELSMIRKDSKGIEIGAAVTISKVIQVLKEEREGGLHSNREMIFKKVADHMDKVASEYIRNTASLGGNLVMAQKNHFPSDIATILLAMDSTIVMQTGSKRLEITLEEFLQGPLFNSKTVLLSVRIPSWESERRVSSEIKTKMLFETFRAAPRPLGNALPYLNAAFLAQVSTCENSHHIILENIHLAFGAYGSKLATRVRKVEEFLAGKLLSYNILFEAISLLKATVVPEKGTSYPAYRTSLAVGFLFDFLHQLVEADADIPSGGLNGFVYALPNKFSGPESSNFHIRRPALLSSAKQVVEVNREYHPIGDPTKKAGAEIQASGEAVYVDDITSPKDCLYGSFIYSTRALARVKDIKLKSTPVPYGIVGIISYKDIPEGGENIGTRTIFNSEPLFADDITQYAGQPLALVVADTQKHADMAANSAVIDYDTEDLGSPILSVEEAVERSSFFEVPPFINPKQIGDFSKGMMEADHKILSAQVAAACALAAHKLRCPVRIYLNRKTDMIMAGGRHPMKINYSVGFKSNGKITALHLDILINAGISEDISPVMPHNMLGALKKYNWGTLSFDIKVCKTNHSSKSAMRAPGEVQASFIAEAVIEHVASFLSMDVNTVRNKNVHTFESLKLFYENSAGESFEYNLISVLDKLTASSNFHRRDAEIRQFNSCSKWKKRGISLVPIVHEVTTRPTPGKVSILPDGSVVVEVGGIELGQGLWTKVKQMAAFALSLVHCDGSRDLLDRVRVIQADTLSLVQGGFTSGSTTSETSCEAVRLCCNVLVERLIPLKERLQKQMGTVSWDMLILQANLQAVNLSASSYYVPEFASMKYLNYGAAVSEVEVDLLTGGTTILRTDIIYDCGQSLNPAVDLGQIEGAFVQGIGFFMLEEYLSNSDGLVVSDGTWTYKIPTIDTIPKQFNVEILNSGHHQKRVLSSKASGEPPLLLAVSVHCATRSAIREARKELFSLHKLEGSHSMFQLDVPATMPVVKELCGLDNVERYLENLLSHQ
ncbi:PREDICTED: indole-3-acetaldehyde oxidase-like isoform X2 [Nelumbo nucifera]|uniref:Indole-3-acetaldehyde oxidase-like isoform X2 n=1 Tax=Nelumbo nucifera TaxID=4432 RepID=A0A1U8PZW7_NELNU|nr:PREDICTED: indole-3-acetaldehyde oxidase-like isoform X2 [Nelumbo nucifera]